MIKILTVVKWVGGRIKHNTLSLVYIYVWLSIPFSSFIEVILIPEIISFASGHTLFLYYA